MHRICELLEICWDDLWYPTLSMVCLGQHHTCDFISQALLLFSVQHRKPGMGLGMRLEYSLPLSLSPQPPSPSLVYVAKPHNKCDRKVLLAKLLS